MNVDKIGEFIKKLRNEKGLTQDELAEKCYISRQAVSKWERQITIPDSSTLLILSDIFDVSINEILAGERITQENKHKINKLFLSIYDERNRRIKQIKIIFAVMLVMLFMFLLYYFITSYRKITVYTISGESSRIEITNGIFINTKTKKYFNLGSLNLLQNNNINSISLYYYDKNNSKTLLLNTEIQRIDFIDFNGYNEYLKNSNIKFFKDSLFLTITYDDNYTEDVKLVIREDYIDPIFVKKDKNIGANLINGEEKIKDEIINKYINNIISKYKKNEDVYQYDVNYLDSKFAVFYHQGSNSIRVIRYDKSKKILEEWNLECINNVLHYNNYFEIYSIIYKNDSFECINGNCFDEEKHQKLFYDILNMTFRN